MWVRHLTPAPGCTPSLEASVTNLARSNAPINESVFPFDCGPGKVPSESACARFRAFPCEVRTRRLPQNRRAILQVILYPRWPESHEVRSLDPRTAQSRLHD